MKGRRVARSDTGSNVAANALWRIEVESLRFAGGYGCMSWVEAAAWSAPDPLSPLATGVVEHMNEHHAAANLLIAQVLGRRADATRATCVDPASVCAIL